MEPTLKTLKASLEAIREMAANALKIEQPQEQHSMRWKFKECRYVKHFTTPVTLETADRCPHVKVRSSELFVNDLLRATGSVSSCTAMKN
jgi:hypothetical protein